MGTNTVNFATSTINGPRSSIPASARNTGPERNSLSTMPGRPWRLTDPETGEIHEAQIFVATLGASNYTFAEATLSQDLPSWIQSHVHAFEFFQGVTEILTPDNLKDAVTRSCRYEPDLNVTYREMAEHYSTVIIPARVGKARDKAKVESGVLQVERWVMAPLRHRTFFSLAELNEAIRDQLEFLNNRPFEKLQGTRKSLFESLEKPVLKPLPIHRFVFAEWKTARVNIDYHIEVDRHYYSVPYQLIHEKVEVRLTDTTVEVLLKGRRVASHLRSYLPGKHTTLSEHMPKSHQKYLQWTPSRLIRWAGTIGPQTQKLLTFILENRPHPEQGYRSCLGVLRLRKRYSPERLEAACARALAFKAYSYKNVESILKNGLDQQPLERSLHLKPVFPCWSMKICGEGTITSEKPHGRDTEIWTRWRKWIVEQMVRSFGESENRYTLISVKCLLLSSNGLRSKMARIPQSKNNR